MKLNSMFSTHADAQILEKAILILENIANRAEANADEIQSNYRLEDDADEIAEMNLEIRDTADRASGAIEDLLYAIKSYDRAGYNDATED